MRSFYRCRLGRSPAAAGHRGGHGSDKSGLPGVQGYPVGCRLQQRQVDRDRVDGASIGAARGGDEPPLSIEDSGRGEQLCTGDGVDR